MSGIQKRVSPSKGLRYRWVRDPNGFLFYSVVIDQHDDRQLLFFSFSSSVLLLLLLLNKKRNHKARCASFRVTDIRLTRLYWCLSPVKERELFRTTDLLQQQVFLSLFFFWLLLSSLISKAMALFFSLLSVTSSLRFYSWQIGYNSHFVTVGASSFLPLQMSNESRINKMRARFVYDCQKESVLTLFNNPLFFSIFRFIFRLIGSTCLTARVAIFAFTV